MSKKFFTITVFLLLSTIVCAQTLRLDNTYGNEGVLNSRLFGLYNVHCHLVTQNNSIIVGLKGNSAINSINFRIGKINPKGSIDSSFGANGLSFISINIDSTILPQSNPIALVEGKDSALYVLINMVNNRAGLVKVKFNGIVDSSFGNNGLVYFDIRGLAITPREITINNNIVYISGYFQENKRFKGFVKAYTSDGKIQWLKSNQAHLEFDNSSDWGVIVNSHVVDFPYIYLAGESVENTLTEFLLIKSNLTDPVVQNIEKKLTLDKWQYHAIIKLKLVDNSFYFIGKFYRNSYTDYTSLIAKLDKNLVFDNTFNKNGIKVSPFYPDKVIYHDFTGNKNKIFITGYQRGSLGNRYFINNITTDGKDVNSFENNSYYYFQGNNFPVYISMNSETQMLLFFNEESEFRVIQYQLNYLSNIDKEALFDFSIFPNPTHSIISFNVNIESVNLFDIQGTLLLSVENTNQLDLSLLNAGMYVLELNEGLIKKYVKVLKN
jgi:hypothetical protein